MFIRRASCQGFTLLELMVALALGSAVMASLGALFVQLERSTGHQQRQLQLHQQTQAILSAISQELGRAGYQRDTGHAATFLHSQRSVEVAPNGDELGMIYQLPQTQSSQDYVHLVYRYQASSQQLLLCEHLSSIPLAFSDVRRSTRSSPCYRVLDAERYEMTDWQVTTQIYRSQAGAVIQQVGLTLTIKEASERRSDTQSLTRLVINGGQG
ncbi:MAG: PilW family protein [Vibrio sp.]